MKFKAILEQVLLPNAYEITRHSEQVWKVMEYNRNGCK